MTIDKLSFNILTNFFYMKTYCWRNAKDNSLLWLCLLKQWPKSEKFYFAGTDFDNKNQNYWTLLLEIYSAFRGYTVVLKSEGIVKKHQADVLGVYRMVDSYNERPVYKQDGGENYIYYRLDNLNEPIIQFLIQFHQQHLVCWNSCWSSVWVAEKFHWECQHKKVSKNY